MNRLTRAMIGSIRKRLILAGISGLLATTGLSACSAASSAHPQSAVAAASSQVGTTSPAATGPTTNAATIAPTTPPPTTKAPAATATTPLPTTKPKSPPKSSPAATPKSQPTIDYCDGAMGTAYLESDDWQGTVLHVTVRMDITPLPRNCPLTVVLTADSPSGAAPTTKPFTSTISGPEEISMSFAFSAQLCNGNITAVATIGIEPFRIMGAFEPVLC